LKASPIHSPFFMKLITEKKLLAACCIISVVALTLFGVLPAKAQTTTIIAFNPANYVATSLGENFTIGITVTDVTNLWEWCVAISWDPSVLNLAAYNQGTFLKTVGSTFWTPIPPSALANGTISQMACTSLSIPEAGATGSGTLATLTFTILKTVATQITLSNTSMLAPETGSSGYHPPIDLQVENATAIVTPVLPQKGYIVADAGGRGQTVNQGVLAILNGSQSSTSDPNATTYFWTFTDGTLKTLEGQLVNYTFNTPGTYNVTLFAQNPYGNSSDWTILTVKDLTPPVARISIQNYIPGQAIVAGQSVLFDSSESTDPYSHIVSYTWDLGDNSPTVSGSGVPTTLHSYSNPGTYNVTLTVTDAAGMSATGTFTISVASPSNTTTSSTPLNLPTYLLGILSFVTILALAGSIFWLRKPRTINETSNSTSRKSR